MNELPYNFDTVEVGDIVQIPYVRSYQHGATMIVTKINRQSFLAQEIEGSYGGPSQKSNSEQRTRMSAAHSTGKPNSHGTGPNSSTRPSHASRRSYVWASWTSLDAHPAKKV
jgi:hypothetical protein